MRDTSFSLPFKQLKHQPSFPDLNAISPLDAATSKSAMASRRVRSARSSDSELDSDPSSAYVSDASSQTDQHAGSSSSLSSTYATAPAYDTKPASGELDKPKLVAGHVRGPRISKPHGHPGRNGIRLDDQLNGGDANRLREAADRIRALDATLRTLEGEIDHVSQASEADRAQNQANALNTLEGVPMLHTLEGFSYDMRSGATGSGSVTPLDGPLRLESASGEQDSNEHVGCGCGHALSSLKATLKSFFGRRVKPTPCAPPSAESILANSKLMRLETFLDWLFATQYMYADSIRVSAPVGKTTREKFQRVAYDLRRGALVIGGVESVQTEDGEKLSDLGVTEMVVGVFEGMLEML